MDYAFSLAREADAPAVFALYRGMIGTPGCTWSDDYPDTEIVLRDIRTDSLYVLKDSRGQLIAAAAAGPDDELKDLPWDLENPCELARVAVAITHQNKGVGTYLLRQVIAAVKARGFGGIRMLVSIHHPHALALYDKNGFQRLDTVHMYGHDFYRYQMAFQSYPKRPSGISL
ncbi:MAG: GNAT family N-acetyltransferase [Bacillota bacterium]